MVSAATSDAQVWPEAAHKRMIEPVVEQSTDNEIMVVAVPGENDIHNNRNSYNDPRRGRASGKDVPRRRNRCLNWRWIVPLILLVVVIVVLVVDLALKPEPADIDHNWVSLRQFSMPTMTNSSASPALNSSRLNLVLETVLVVSNPNLVGRFQYFDGGVYLFYHGREAAHASIPPGAIPTQRSRNISALVSTNSEALVAEEDAVLPFTTETNMTGFVRTWAVFKQHFQIASVCEVLLSVQSHNLVRYSCHDKKA